MHLAHAFIHSRYTFHAFPRNQTYYLAIAFAVLLCATGCLCILYSKIVHKWKFLYACSLTCSKFARDFPFKWINPIGHFCFSSPSVVSILLAEWGSNVGQKEPWCSCSCCPVAQDYSASLCISIRWFIPTSQSFTQVICPMFHLSFPPLLYSVTYSLGVIYSF